MILVLVTVKGNRMTIYGRKILDQLNDHKHLKKDLPLCSGISLNMRTCRYSHPIVVRFTVITTMFLQC